MICISYSDPVIPKGNVVLPPLKPHVRFLRGGDDLSEVAHNIVTLELGHAHDARDKARVEKQTVPAGDRVCADQRMLCGDGRPPDSAAEGLGVVGLHVRRV